MNAVKPANALLALAVTLVLPFCRFAVLPFCAVAGAQTVSGVQVSALVGVDATFLPSEDHHIDRK